ncbi:MAG: polysaccharide pyruvyl transferase family protein [Eubacterium sp.]
MIKKVLKHQRAALARKDEKFGCIQYTSVNIGDEIQSVAAMRFLPQIDYYVPRERVDEFHSDHGEKVKLFMNAWWMWEQNHFPPSEDIDPLFVSFHLREAMRNDEFMRKDVIQYFKDHEPIGCRDTGTVEFLKRYGIDAYFTGCLTSTLLPNEKIKKERAGRYILCVDVPTYMEEKIRERSDLPVYTLSRNLFPAFSSIERFKVAKIMLYAYHNAACVVTPRLHVGLPAVAFHTPVCMLTTDILTDKILKRRGRFDGIEDVFNQVKVEDYMKDPTLYDINNPPENPDAYHRLADNLVEISSGLTGYDSGKPVFDDDFEPLIEILSMLEYSKPKLERAMYFATNNQMIKAIVSKAYDGKNRYDLKF